MRKQISLRTLAKAAFHQILNAAPDELAIRLYYLRARGNPFLRLRKPRTFNEKMQYRKLYEHDPRMPPLVDKIEVKKFVADRLGPEWIIPTLYAGTDLPPRDERNWPLPYVIKPSHRSHEILFVRHATDIDWPHIEAKCAEWTASHYGAAQREWAYRQISPRILVETFIGKEKPPPDFKIFVFDSRAHFVQVSIDRFGTYRQAIFDRDWQRQYFSYISSYRAPYEGEIERPACLTRMLSAAEELAAGWPFVRVDLYVDDGAPKFGELTFYPLSGAGQFSPPEWDRVLGDLWPDRVSPETSIMGVMSGVTCTAQEHRPSHTSVR